MTQELQRDRKDLKIQALLEKVGSLTTNYENQVADLRVDLTLATAEVNRLTAELSYATRPSEDTDETEEESSLTDDSD